MLVNIINESNHPLPDYASEGSSGMDLRAYLPEFGSTEIKPGERMLIPTGVYIKLPEGYEAQIRPRSGLAHKFGITVLNSPGTIDSDYVGEIRVILINLGDAPFIVSDGDRIAQMVVAPYTRVTWEPNIPLAKTKRGDSGFGSSGIK